MNLMEDNNMPLGVRFDDVTSCEVDVIVNSLGTVG